MAKAVYLKPMQHIKTFLALAFLLLSWACTQSEEPSAPATINEDRWQKTELYFGQTMNGQTIPDSLWQDFRTSALSKNFSGFTEIPTRGFWTDDTGNELFENSKMILYVHPLTAKEDSLIEVVRETYKSRFNQQSVLRVDVEATVSF